MAKRRKRLALLVGQADEDYQSRFITGFTKQAFDRGKDVCVFSMYKKYQDTTARELGESNIFTLLNPDFFDGILILKDTIQTSGIAEQIEERLHNEYNGPVLVIDLDSKYYKSVFIDCFTPVLDLTNHLIEDHGLKDIAFLTGKKKHRHSITRQKAFEKAMKQHGLEVPKKRIIEGDFWYLSGEQCADALISSGEKLPEAIVCADDQMAIGVCKAFAEKGVRVPEDIVVVGCDANGEGMTSPKILTSYRSPAFELGAYSVDALEDIRTGKTPREFTDKAKIIYGETCGCDELHESGINIRRPEWTTTIYENGFDSVNSMLFEDLMLHSDLMDYLGTVYSYAYQIKGAESFYLCLVDGIQNMGVTAPARNDGYTDKMIEAIRYDGDHHDDMVTLDGYFDVNDILPELSLYRDKPQAFFFVPIFFEDKCFGYAAVSYGNVARSYDDLFRRWIKSICFGFENLHKNSMLSGLRSEVSSLRSDKFDKVDLAFASLSMTEREEYELVKEIIDNNLLSYHFQPIVSAKDGSIYSYEALMRSGARQKLSPLAILKYASMQDRFPEIESATFNNVLDIVSKHKSEIGNAKIFVNSIPGIRVDDIDTITKKLKENSDCIVVELTEESELDDDNLNRLKEYFQTLGIEIAVDDYGTGYSNISNLLRYMPNYVKIDRSLLSEIHNKPQKQHFVREIIEFCHANNIMALAEGVETTEELRMVIHLGADLIQGFYTGRPEPQFVGKIKDSIINEIKSYYQERSDGKSKQVYVAGKTNRVSLISLAKDGCTDIVIGKGDMVYKDISIVGMPSLKSEVHLTVEPGYSGRITLDNVYFSNIKNRPCIDLGENTDVTLLIEGYNYFKNTGICVPESSSLVIDGAGNLTIELTNIDFYGIGNDEESTHGDITMLQGGKLKITANGTRGTYIGSGLGGKINIQGGSYELSGYATDSVGIGSLYGESDVIIRNCGIDMDISGTKNAGVGSLEKSTKVQISECSFKHTGDGREVVGLGSIRGEHSFVKIHNAMAEFLLNADSATALGALNGNSELDISIASIRIEGSGIEALAYGGVTGETEISLSSVDTRVKLFNKSGKDTFAPDENIKILNGRCKVIVNGNEIERDLVFKFE